jgi:hypothetical protein
MSGRYESSVRIHEESARRHEAAAALWDTRHEARRAEFERRCAQIERAAAQLDADRSELERLRASGLAHRDTALRAEIDRLTGEIERCSARLQSDSAALERDRMRLWPHRDKREHEQSAPAANAPRYRDAVASEPEPRKSSGVEEQPGAATPAVGQARENARRLSSILSQTAKVLDTSAALAQAHAERLEHVGREDAGAEERRAAQRAGEAARRARLHAKHWLEFTPGGPQ